MDCLAVAQRPQAPTKMLTVDFEHFYRWWTDAMGNFTDPKGFSDMANVRKTWAAPSCRKSLDYIEDAIRCALLPISTTFSSLSRVFFPWHVWAHC